MKIKINNFEGPLDLLLQLIEKEEMDITEVSLLQVTNQYINYLEKIEKKEPEMLADFLLIAAKLLYIKSRVLLPELEADEEESSVDLANQLKMYKRYLDASRKVQEKFYQQGFAFSRPDSIKRINIDFVPPASLNKSKLKRIFGEIIKGLEVMAGLPKKSLERAVSIKEKIRWIQNLIENKQMINFSDLVGQVKSRTEVVVSFLAVLELAKQRLIYVQQDYMFGDITVETNKKDN